VGHRGVTGSFRYLSLAALGSDRMLAHTRGHDIARPGQHTHRTNNDRTVVDRTVDDRTVEDRTARHRRTEVVPRTAVVVVDLEPWNR
jgi:hypothetical protein